MTWNLSSDAKPSGLSAGAHYGSEGVTLASPCHCLNSFLTEPTALGRLDDSDLRLRRGQGGVVDGARVASYSED